MKNPKTLEFLHLSELNFDPQNPRFGVLNLHGTLFDNDDNIIQKMIDEERIIDLITSIADQGYFEGEPLLVFIHKKNSYIVAEGNRRLAALKVLNGDVNVTQSMQEIINNARNKPVDIPCIIFKDRSEVLHFLGYRHITGVKSWGALEKAIYLQQLKDDLSQHDPNLDDIELHRKLAREIGSNATAVAKSLTSLAIYNRGFNADKSHFFELQKVTPDEIQFSLIYTALGYTNILEFIGLESSNDVHLRNLNTQHAKELFGWMFSENEIGQKLIAESRQLKLLNQIVANPSAITVLKETHDLKIAFSYSAGPMQAFDDYRLETDKIIDRFQRLLRDGIKVEQTHFKTMQRLSDEFQDLFTAYKRRFNSQQEDEN